MDEAEESLPGRPFMVGVSEESSSALLPKLSGNLVFPTDEVARKKLGDGGGVQIEITLTRGDETQTVGTATTYVVPSNRAAFQELLDDDDSPEPVLSIQSFVCVSFGFIPVPEGEDAQDWLEVEPLRHGVEVPLPTAWSCLEMYPRFDVASWTPGLARTWAQRDLARNKVGSQSRTALKRSADAAEPAVAFHRVILRKLRRLIDEASSGEGNEESLHQFLAKHPVLLSPTHDVVRSKVRFGRHVSDFVVRESGGTYLLVEIESPQRRLYTKSGQRSSELIHAIDQTSDWMRYIQDNKATVERELDLSGISSSPRRLVVLGRSEMLSDSNRRRRKTDAGATPGLEVLTWDELVDRNESALSNLFGAAWNRRSPLQVRLDGVPSALTTE